MFATVTLATPAARRFDAAPPVPPPERFIAIWRHG
jgi:hypothetical protein